MEIEASNLLLCPNLLWPSPQKKEEKKEKKRTLAVLFLIRIWCAVYLVMLLSGLKFLLLLCGFFFSLINLLLDICLGAVVGHYVGWGCN